MSAIYGTSIFPIPSHHGHRVCQLSLCLCVLPSEQARNLVYMVQRRERLKKQLIRSRTEVFELESKLLEEEVEEEERERLENELSFRQTR